MKTKILEAIKPILDDTSIMVEMWEPNGKPILEIPNIAPIDDENKAPLRLPSINVIKKDVMVDLIQNKCFFSVSMLKKSFICAVTGCDEVSRNYAVILKSLINSAINNEIYNTDDIEEFSLLFQDALTEVRQERLREKFWGSEKTVFGVIRLVGFGKRHEELVSFLEEFLSNDDLIIPVDDSIVILRKSLNNDDYQSIYDYALVLNESVINEINIKLCIGVGGVAEGLEQTYKAYLDSVNAVRVGKLIDPTLSVFNYKDYFLVRVFEGLPIDSLRKFSEVYINEDATKIFEDQEIMDTIEQFLHGSLNVSETSRNMYIHRNTLLYRLDKIERTLGLNVRNFNDAVTFRCMSIIYKIMKYR